MRTPRQNAKQDKKCHKKCVGYGSRAHACINECDAIRGHPGEIHSNARKALLGYVGCVMHAMHIVVSFRHFDPLHIVKTRRADHGLGSSTSFACREDMLFKIYTVPIQPRKYVLDHGDYAAPTRQHELDRTDQVPIYLPFLEDLDHELGIDYLCHLSDVGIISRLCSSAKRVHIDGFHLHEVRNHLPGVGVDEPRRGRVGEQGRPDVSGADQADRRLALRRKRWACERMNENTNETNERANERTNERTNEQTNK